MIGYDKAYFKQIKKDFPNINLRPYLFRHSMATHMLKQKINLMPKHARPKSQNQQN